MPALGITPEHWLAHAATFLSVQLTHQIFVVLLARARSAHSIGFTSARLAICHQRNIVSLCECIDAVRNITPNTALRNIGTENSVEDE